MTYRGGTHRLPLGHREYTRHDPRTGKTIIVQAKGVVPTKRPTAARKDVYNDLAGIALKDPKRAQGIVNNFTDIFKKDYLHAFKFRNLSVEDEKAISNMVDDRFRNPYIKLISTAEMVGRNKKSTKDYEKVIQYTRNLIDKNIKEVCTAMATGKIPELDKKMAQQLSLDTEAKSCKNLPSIIKSMKKLPTLLQKSSAEWTLQNKDVDMVYVEEHRKLAEEARRRKYFLEGRTKPQRELKKALEKMLKKQGREAKKLMDGFNVIKALRGMTSKGKGWNRIYNKATGRTGAITQGINSKNQRFASKIQMTQRFKKNGRAFDRYVIERVVNGKKTTETHDFDITGSGLFTHGFEGCVREAQSKGYVPNSEQAEKLCGWILQEAGVNVARQGLSAVMGMEELKQYGGNAPVITRGKGGKHPIHQKQYTGKVRSQVKGAGKQYLGSRPGGYSQKQFGGRVGLPPRIKGKKR